jgi:hypothetical protein
MGFSLYGSAAFVDLGRFFSFLILYTVGRTPWTGDQPIARPLPTHRTTQTQNKRTQTSMPRVVFKLTKTVHALDRAAAVIVDCGFNTVYPGRGSLTFRKKILPPFLGLKSEERNWKARSWRQVCQLLLAWFTFERWRWRQNVSPKRQWTSALHHVRT